MGRRGALRVVAGLADQAVYSLTNFVLTLLVARVASRAEFGVYALLAVTVIILVALNRGIAADPVVVRYSGSSTSEWRWVVELRFGLSLVVGVVLGVVFAVVALTVLPGTFGPMAVVFACGLPAVFVQDYLRYAAFAAARSAEALVNDLAVAATQIAVSAVLLIAGVRSPSAYVLVWVGAAVVGSAVAVGRLRVRPRRVRPAALLSDADLAGRYAADNVINQVSQQGTAYVVGGIVAVAAAGALRAAQTVYMPLSVIALGIQSAVVPELVRLRRRSPTALRRAVLLQAGLMLTLVVVYSGIVLSTPDSLGRRLLGDSWSDARPLLPALAVAAMGACLMGAAVAGMRALGDAAGSLRTRTITVVVTATLVVPAAALGGLRPAVIAIAVATWLQGMVWWARFSRSYRTGAGEGVRQDVASAGVPSVDAGEV